MRRTLEATLPVCPRCMGFIPRNEVAGAYPGAMSRTDNETEICSECGLEEALSGLARGGNGSQEDWPVKSERQMVTPEQTKVVV